jgi:hypothetical protein
VILMILILLNLRNQIRESKEIREEVDKKRLNLNNKRILNNSQVKKEVNIIIRLMIIIINNLIQMKMS